MRVGDRATAQMVMNNFTTTRGAFVEALSAMDWESVAALDPLYEPRYGEQLSAALRLSEPPSKGWLGFEPPVLRWALPAAIVAGCGLWFANNVIQDQFAFQRARTAGTVRAWKEYLARENPRQRVAVINHELPAVAFEAARRADTSSALREFLSRYANTAVAAKAEAMLRAHFENARSNVRSTATGESREQLLQLIDWIEAHPGVPIEVRFNASSEMFLKGFDSFVEELQEFLRARGERVDVASVAPSFTEKEVARREAQILSFLTQGFESLLGDVVSLRRGGAFSGRPTGFDTPTLAVLAVAEPTDHPHVDLGSGKVYLDLSFKFELTLTVPGGQERQLSFEHVPTESLPAKYFPRTLPESYSNLPLYELMVALAYEEMQQRTASYFFPKQIPRRTLVLPTAAAVAPETPARRTGPISSATGFCLSPDGYVVTAQHFTATAKTFRVKAKGGAVLDADLVAQDEEHDLALLKVRGGLPTLSLRPSTEVKLGSAVATIGFPNTTIQGLEPKVGRGEVSSLAGIRDDPALFQVSVPVQPGNSGGPLLDVHGNVIGVINSRLVEPGAQNVNYAVKSVYVVNLFQRAHVPLPPSAPSASAVPNFEDMIATALQATVLIEGY